jgi:fused signal recognition particle receptor
MFGKTKNSTAEPRSSFFKRLRSRLNSGDSWLTYDLANLAPGARIDDEVLEDLESRLVMADVGVDATEQIIADMRELLERRELKDVDALMAGLRQAMIDRLDPVARVLQPVSDNGPFVILMVGINGAGKTTTI